MREETLSTLKQLHEHSVTKKQIEIAKYLQILNNIEQLKNNLELQLVKERKLARNSLCNGSYLDTWVSLYNKKKQGYLEEEKSINTLINKCKQELMAEWRKEKKYDNLIAEEKNKRKQELLNLEQKEADELAIARHLHLKNDKS